MYDSEATSVDTAAETEVDSGAETEIDDRNSKHSPTRTSSPPQVYINPSHSHAHYKESTDRKFTSQKKLFHHPITAPSDRELIERKFVRKDNEKRKHGSLFHHATNNCMMAHYLTWAEIVGQAFDLENQMEDEAEKEKKKDVEKENTVDVKGLGQLSGNANKEAKGLCIDIDIVSKTTPKTTPKTNKNMIFSNMGESNTPISHATTSNLSDTSPSGGVWDRVSPKSRLDALEAKNKEHLDNEDRVKREKEEANKGKRALAMESFEKESTNTPGCVYLKIVMKDYFQSWIGSKVIGRLEADVTTTDVLNTFEINPSMVEKASAKTNISATANSTAGPSSNEENETRVKHDDDPMADADEAAGLLENNSVHSDLTDENDVAGLGSDPFQTLFNQRRNKDMGSLSGFHKLSKIIQNSINIHTNGQNKGGKISNMDKESGKSKNSKSDYYYSHISMSGDAGDDDNDDDDDDEKEAFEKQTVEARNAHRRARVLAEGQLSAGDDKQWISDRVSTLSELSEMKARFDEERKSRFVAEVQNVLSSFLQSVHILLINSVHTHMATKSVEHEEEEEEKYNKHKLDPFHDHDCDVDREMKYWETVHDFNSGVSFTRHEDHQKVHINRDKEKHHLRDADNEGFLGCNSV